MEASELFRTCANEHVAAGALRSLGGALLRRIDAAAAHLAKEYNAPAGEIRADIDELVRGLVQAKLVQAAAGQGS